MKSKLLSRIPQRPKLERRLHARAERRARLRDWLRSLRRS